MIAMPHGNRRFLVLCPFLVGHAQEDAGTGISLVGGFRADPDAGWQAVRITQVRVRRWVASPGLEQRPDATLLLVPGVSAASWLSDPPFVAENRVGAVGLRPGIDWFRDRLLRGARPGTRLDADGPKAEASDRLA